MKLPVVLLCTVLFSGCASYEWRHPTTSATKADASLLVCEEKALKLYPILVQQNVRGGRAKGATTNCAALKKGSAAAASCVQSGGKSYGASTYSRDVTRPDRTRATERCMRAGGWRKVKIDG